jgi:hypothetical protein
MSISPHGITGIRESAQPGGDWYWRLSASPRGAAEDVKVFWKALV